MFFIVNFIGNNAVWLIVVMTTERFIVVMFPLKGKHSSFTNYLFYERENLRALNLKIKQMALNSGNFSIRF